MSITYDVKLSQTELWSSQKLFIDETYASTGIEVGKFLSVKADGTTLADTDGVTPTWQLADSTGLKPAQSLVFISSDVKRGKPVDEQIDTPDKNFYPFGKRECEGLIVVEKSEIVVKDSTRDRFFNTTVKPLAGTVSVAGGALTTLVGVGTAFTTALRVGDYILVNGVEKQVEAIATDTSLTVTVGFAGAVASTTASISSDLFKPIYLSTNGGFTKLVPTTVGTLKQKVGFVINGNNFVVDLDDKQGTIL